MNISCLFFGILFVVGGFLFAIGKLHTHISAWKEMTDDEKDKINIVPLCVNIGSVIMLCGFIFLIKGLTIVLKGKFFIIAMIAWLIIAGIDVRHISKSSRYINK